MKASRLCLVLMAFSATLSAQPKPASHPRLSHPLIRSRVESPTLSAFRDTVRVLALMVDFPVSADPRITGNGKFMLQPVADLVDPPPHDVQYFSYKMQFIQNYFRKVSNGKLTVVGTVLNRVMTVSKQPQQYAPTSSSSNAELASLAAESWAMADSAYPGFPFNRYDAFVVFHAGIGHDINIVDLLGYDPTPLNLPSLYFGPQALKDAFQNPSYNGVPVSGGSFNIDNTILLPETETQFVVTSQGPDTLQFSINGLFAASIGSYLGLPDLWDTKTGLAGIGQYGLEDGASFFAYFGLFPPEPSAWEKIRLGWVTPITITSTSLNLQAPAVSLYHDGQAFVGQDTIYKVPINSTEYFLVENRSRHPINPWQKLTIIENGIPVTKYFYSDSVGFSNGSISAITGSVVDAENYDWALIGDLSQAYDGGGIIIWHIDENVINAGLLTNTVNANPDAKGVKLEEAKGAQDIGQIYSFLDGGYGTTNGDPLDLWFSSNVAQTYANRFDRSSIPNSNANSGANSLISIKDFSDRLPRMTLSVQIGDSYLNPTGGFPKTLGVSSSDKSVQRWTNGIYASKGDSVYVFRSDGTSGTRDFNGLLTSNGGGFPLMFDSVLPNSFFVGARDSSVILIGVVDLNGDGVIDSVYTNYVNVGHRITTPPSLNGTGVVVGHAGGGIVQVDPTTKQVSDVVTGLSNEVVAVVLSSTAVTKSGVKNSAGQTYSFAAPFTGFAVGQGSRFYLVDTVQRTITVLTSGLSIYGQASLANWQGSISSPVAGDIYHNGVEDVFMTIGNSIIGFNPNGTLIDGFPLKIVADAGNASPVLLTKLSSDGLTDLLAVSSTGLVSAYSNNGKNLPGFPIDIGTSVTGAPVAFPISATSGAPQTGFAVMGNDGTLYAYQVSANYIPVDVGPPVPISTDFLPASRVYNWPNPVYGNTTQIRFYSAQDATVSIAIFDIAGKKITELDGKALAGIDTELTWNVSHIQSGVYLAKVEASNQNQKQVRIIKIAVVK